MATGVKAGLSPYRMVGSGPDNGALSEYEIASGYSTGLGIGDPVKLHTDGTIIRATNTSADAIGVFCGVKYTDASGKVVFSRNWVASTTGTDIKALVDDQPMRTFLAKGDRDVSSVVVGKIYAMNLTAPDTATGRSTATVKLDAAVVATAGLVKVINIVDTTNRALEVVLVDHALRDDG